MFTLVQRIGVFAAAAVGLFAQSTPVSVPETTTSGMIGITEGQNIRLNALNPGETGVATPAVAAACTAALTYWDAAGTLLKSYTVPVPPGKSMYVDLFGQADLALVAGARREIRGSITISPLPPVASTAAAAPCKLIGTLELMDAPTGKTLVVIGVGHVVPAASVGTSTP